MRYLVDTNVLLRWSDRTNPSHGDCAEAIERIIAHNGRVYTCAQVLIEYWAVATRPVHLNGFGFSTLDASSSLAEARRVFICLPEPPDMADRWERAVSEHNVLGKQAHDARLVALMLSHGITQLLTLNAPDFARYPEIKTLTPAEVLAL